MEAHRRAKDDDRNAAIALVRNAAAAGRISEPDRDHRIQAIEGARTIGDIQVHTRDLQDFRPGPPAPHLPGRPGPHRLPPPPARAPGQKGLLVAILVLVGLFVLVPILFVVLVTVVMVSSSGDGGPGGIEESAEIAP